MADGLVSGHLISYTARPLTSVCDHRPKSLKSDFKKPGPDAMGAFRCVLISGPPGIGKTTAAHLVAKMQGYDILELNASDVRSKKLLEVSSLERSRSRRACQLTLAPGPADRPPSSPRSRTRPSRASSRRRART